MKIMKIMKKRSTWTNSFHLRNTTSNNTTQKHTRGLEHIIRTLRERHGSEM